MTEVERRFLVFTMNNRMYAFDLSQIAEVSTPPQMWPIPLAPACYRGAMNFHGTIVAVMDLMAFVDIPSTLQPDKVLILDTALASLALLVERVVRIVPESQAGTITPLDDGITTGIFFLPDGEVTLLDARRIVEHATAEING